MKGNICHKMLSWNCISQRCCCIVMPQHRMLRWDYHAIHIRFFSALLHAFAMRDTPSTVCCCCCCCCNRRIQWLAGKLANFALQKWLDFMKEDLKMMSLSFIPHRFIVTLPESIKCVQLQFPLMLRKNGIIWLKLFWFFCGFIIIAGGKKSNAWKKMDKINTFYGMANENIFNFCHLNKQNLPTDFIKLFAPIFHSQFLC